MTGRCIVHRRECRLGLALSLSLAATIASTTACSRGVDAVAAADEAGLTDTSLTVPGALASITIQTYDGSNEAVHPDFLTPLHPWSHRPRYLAITPYPNGNTKYENPSLYSGSNGMDWSIAKGTPNPLVFPRYGYFSDPDIVYANNHNELFLYYRQVAIGDHIFLIRSTNGTSWSSPQEVVTAAETRALSPAVVRVAAGNWMMYTVSADSGCRGPSARVQLRRSGDGIVWSNPEDIEMDLHGYSPWHLDVQWIPSREEFWALVPVKTAGTCATRQLMLTTSRDGVNWITLPNPVARAGETGQFRDVIYRSTFAYDASADAVTLWLSGARMSGETFIWSMAAVRRTREDLFSPLRASAVVLPADRRHEVDDNFEPPQ